MMDLLPKPVRFTLAFAAAFWLLLGAGSAAPAEPPGNSSSRNITVLTRNLYFGFAEQSLLTATTPEELIAAAAQAWADVQKTDFPARARSIARDIVFARADLVGLQEAVRYELLSGGPGGPTGFIAALDFVDVLLAELERLGSHFSVAANVTDTDVAVPITADASQWVHLIDRDVVLVRSDLPASDLRITATASGNYTAYIPVPTPLGEIQILRGWVSADVRFRGESFRFISTHLEDASSGIPEFLLAQEAQATELLVGPANTELPLILVGDFNSDADTSAPTYQILTGAGLTDVWSVRHPRLPGFTCCQDADLANVESALSERIDLILTRGAIHPAEVRLVGETFLSKVLTPDGLIWPSDHAGVFAVLLP